MKPLFGFDRTTDKKNTVPEGSCFIAATVSDLTRQGCERALTSATEKVEKAQLPGILRGLRTVSGWLAAMVFIGILRGMGEVTLAQAYENAAFLFWGLGALAALWAVLTLLNNRKLKSETVVEDLNMAVRRMEAETDRAYRELQVPDNAKEVDVVRISYRWKDGKLKMHTQGMETTPYTNVSLRVFRREDVLCLADTTNRYDIPIAWMSCLRRVKKPLILQGWNKDEPINAEFYKPYKLTMDNYERVHTKAYGLLEFSADGVDWALWLPPYELNYISALTGLPITEE